MKVYGLPDHVHVPGFDESFVDGRYSMEKDDEVTKEFFARVKDYCVNELGGTGKLTGEIIRFPIADGYAQYMVCELPRTTFLIHLRIHDGWQIPEAHERGLRKQDVKEMVDREKRLAELFGRKS